jgi:hypothetical protein
VAQPKTRRVDQTDPAESIGRNRSTCPVCRAQIAFDDGDRMNYHRFPGYDATCVASDRPRGWFPSTVEDGLPKRLRTGEAIPRRDLRRIESAVAKVVAIRHESERAEKRRTRIASMSEEERRRSRVRYREVSGGAPGLGKRR